MNNDTGEILKFTHDSAMKAFIKNIPVKEMPVHGFTELGNMPVKGCAKCKGTGVERILAGGRRIPCDCTSPKQGPTTEDQLKTALAEVERLKAELEEAHREYEILDKDLAEQITLVGEQAKITKESEAENAALRAALLKIASFNEGPVVTTSFDEPGSAQIARDVLAHALPGNALLEAVESAGKALDTCRHGKGILREDASCAPEWFEYDQQAVDAAKALLAPYRTKEGA